MSRNARLAIGIATVAPVTIVLIATVGLIGATTFAVPRTGVTSTFLAGTFYLLLLGAAAASTLVRLFYGYLIAANEAMAGKERGLWMVAFLLTGEIAAIVYWLLYIWPRDER